MVKLCADKALRMRLFPRGSPVKLIGLLEKIVPLDPTINIASLLRIDKTALQRSIENVKRQEASGA